MTLGPRSLEALLQGWRSQLTAWSIDGSLSSSARTALLLPDGPDPEVLTGLIGAWAAGDFSTLPPIEVLEGSVLPAAAGAYAISTGTIYLNGDWLASASEQQVIAVLTEELGHHLDGLLNSADTPGDEGELFAALLLQNDFNRGDFTASIDDADHGVIAPGGEPVEVEYSVLFRYPIISNSYFFTDNQDFGRRPLIEGIPNSNMHYGLDFGRASGVVLGTPVYAAAGGVVTRVRNDGSSGLGKHIYIAHADGFETRYGHLDDFAVSQGSQVSAGQLIGKAGNTGWSDGVHLHFEIRLNGVAKDPEEYLKVSTTSPPPPPPPSTDPRLVLPIFDPQFYLATYEDVRNTFGASNFEGAKSHWLQFGITEGRRGSLVFDPKDYLQRFQDVANAYGATNYAGAISHWLEWGLRYGRRGSVEFDPIYYMAAHPDVEAAYGVMNFSGAISHYYQWGKPGGWYGSEWITDSSAFQLGYYLDNNADVKAVTNNANQEVEATRHWYFIGINEGRRGSPEFNAKFYLAKYEDVRAALGANNYRGALDNYLLFGKAGGRIGADDTPRTLSINDVSITEGNSGSQLLVFTVSLNIVTGETVTVNYSTADGTATSGSASADFRGVSGSLSFAPGETSKTISIEIFGDTTFESDETFVVSLSNSTYASIAKGQGIGTIQNNDPQIINDGKSSFSIVGNPVVGKTLTATKTADDPDGNGTFTYVWQSSSDGNSWSTIGSNSASLLLGFSEAGKQVRFTISYTDSEGFAETVSVAPLSIGRGVVTAAITGISDNVGLIQGTVTQGGVTDDRTPTITGKFSAPLVSGESIRIFNGTVLLGNAVVNNTTGTWSFTPTLPATAGTNHSITARVANAAGTLGPASPARTFTLDTTASTTTAAISNVLDNGGLIQGTVAPGGRTDDRTPTITGTITSALAAGETLRIFNGATLLGTAAVNNLAKTWSFTPTLPATPGTTYSITARVADPAGNLGTPSAPPRTFFLDSIAPMTTAAITGVADNVGLIKGPVAPGARTDDTTPTITGTLTAAMAAGETLRIFNGATLLGTAAVNNLAKTWSFTPTLPASAGTSYSITARVADPAGNLGTPSAPPRTFFLDSIAPTTTAAITGVADNAGLIRGPVAPGARTDDTTPTITGTISSALVAGETLRIFNGATLLGTAAVNNLAKTWSFTPTLPATPGTTYSITTRVADPAGNLGTTSQARSFTLDTTAPSVASFSPLDRAAGFDPAANIILTFSEAIQRGSGAIQLRVGSATGPITESFDAATSTRLSISGTGLTINPTSNLAPNTQFFLTFPAGSLIDRAGNPFAGTSTYDFRTTNVVAGTPASDILSFTNTVDRLTGLAGADTFRLSALSQARLPASPTTPIDRITDFVTGLDSIDAPVARTLATALKPTEFGAVTELSAAALGGLLTPASFPAFTTTSIGGAATFTFGTRTFLAINDGVAGFSAATDSILEITGASGGLNQLQIF